MSTSPNATTESPFLAAAAGRHYLHTPVWFMRQAGRSLPEYKAIRGDGSILEAIKQPHLAAEITLQPVQRYGVDAAVLFSDIVVPPHAVGFGIDVAPGTGPVAETPFRSPQDLLRLRPLEPRSDLAYVIETVKILARELPTSVPLLAFAGAPFTVASYLIEGRPSRTYQNTKRMIHLEPALWHQLMERLTQHSVSFIDAQLSAGAQAFQLLTHGLAHFQTPTIASSYSPTAKMFFSNSANYIHLNRAFTLASAVITFWNLCTKLDHRSWGWTGEHQFLLLVHAWVRRSSFKAILTLPSSWLVHNLPWQEQARHQR